MAESARDILEFLQNLRRERDELNVLIAGIERRVGIAAVQPDADEYESVSATATPKVNINIADIPVGFFHNMSQPAAAEKLFRLNPGQPLTTPEILDAFRRSGMYLNPKNATTILYTALSRNSKFERVAGKAWGLAEWYPENKKRESKRKAEPEHAETAKAE